MEDKAGTEKIRTTGRDKVKKSYCAHENIISLTEPREASII